MLWLHVMNNHRYGGALDYCLRVDGWDGCKLSGR